MKGEMPQQKDEIAIDRMYADNNDLQVGDVISVDKKELTVTGLVALSDYSALFSNSSDMMFDAVKFGVGIMTEEGYVPLPMTISNTAIPGNMIRNRKMKTRKKNGPMISSRFWRLIPR